MNVIHWILLAGYFYRKITNMNKTNISHVSNLHNQWLRTLNFYKTEIAIHKGMLTEIAGKNTNNDMLKEVEHFENQFRVQNDNIDRIAHGIHVNIDAIGRQASESQARYIDSRLLTDHTRLGQETDDEVKIMTDTIHSFRTFAAKWM